MTVYNFFVPLPLIKINKKLEINTAMTDKQNAKWEMYLLILQVLKKNQALYADISVFENLVKELEEICNQIVIVSAEQ